MDKRRVAIYGAGENGRTIADMLCYIFTIECFFDQDVGKVGKCIYGIPIRAISEVQYFNGDIILSTNSAEAAEFLSKHCMTWYYAFDYSNNFFCRPDVMKIRDDYLLERFLFSHTYRNRVYSQRTDNWFRESFLSLENEKYVHLVKKNTWPDDTYSADYYDEYFENRSDMRLVANIIDYLFVDEGVSVCDLGCGKGALIRELSKRGKKVCGVDSDKEKTTILKSEGLFVECSDIYEVKFKNLFDVVISMHVLEHVYDVEKIIRKIYSLLKVGGKVFIGVPNGGSIEDNTHVRHFTINILANLLINGGFSIDNVQEVPYLNYENENALLCMGTKK